MAIPILIVTIAASLWDAIALWAAAVLVFLLHFGVHLVQALAWGGYTPAALTSVPGAIWCIWALIALDARGGINWPVALTLILPVALAASLFFLAAHRIAARRAC